jgi:hypothetical protein
MEKDKNLSYLCPVRLGLAAGIYFALAVFVCTIFGHFTGHGKEMFALLKTMWPGYDTTVVGAFIGALYGFIKGFLAFLIIAALYDWMLCCRCCQKEESSCCTNDNKCSSDKK